MLLSDLPVGSLVKDTGSKYNDKPIIWRIVDTNHNGFPTNSVTLQANNILSIKKFDLEESNSSDSDRKAYGNNRWKYSNIRQWLNSDLPAPWYTASYPEDAVPDYSNENGFMSNLSLEFKNNILDTSIITQLSSIDGGTLETTLDKFFLFSMTEMNLTGASGKEGYPISYFSQAGVRVLKPTQEACDTSEYKSVLLDPKYGFTYWLRTPQPDFSYVNYNIKNNGSFAQIISNSPQVGVSPSVNLNNSITILRQDTDGTYILGFSQPIPIDWSTIDEKILDNNTTKEIIEGQQFQLSKSPSITWSKIDAITYEASLKLNNNPVSNFTDKFVPNTLGSYELTLHMIDSNTPTNTKDIIRTFSILKNPINLDDLDFHFTDEISSVNITTGSIFNDQAQITWNEIDGVTISASLKKNGIIDTSFNKHEILTEGSYTVTYSLTDNSYPDNNLSNTITFIIKGKEIDWSQFKLKVTDMLTKIEITENSIFQQYCQPTWDNSDIVNITYSLLLEGTTVDYTKGNILNTLGSYILSFHLVDIQFPDNTHDISLPFTIVKKITDLGTVSLPIINQLTGKVINSGQVFHKESVSPTWDETTLPSDVSLVSFNMVKDSSILPSFIKGTKLSDVGSYKLTIQIKNGANNTLLLVTNFTLDDEDNDLGNLKIPIIDSVSNTEITEGRIFQEVQVSPTWVNPDETKFYIDFKLEEDGNLLNQFFPEITILSDFAKYKLTLTVTSIDGDPDDKQIIERNFSITQKKVDMGNLNIPVRNKYTSQLILNGDTYNINVKPIWDETLLPTSIIIESTITYNGTKRPYDKSDDNDYLSKVGDYILELKCTDKNFPDNTKVFDIGFTIINTPLDLADKSIIIKDELTDNEITEGELFSGDPTKPDSSGEVQPTWIEDPALVYTYNLIFNGNNLNDYHKEDILRTIGSYRLTVIGADPHYAQNNITKVVNFSIVSNKGQIDDNSNYDAYLNGLPYELGTPITKSGDYNLLVVAHKDSNFQISTSEVNFKVVSDNEDEPPLILPNPIETPAIKDTVTILYPNYSLTKEYCINNDPNWHTYTEPFDIDDNVLIHARYKDPQDYYVYADRQITNIDKLPPDPPVLLGFRNTSNEGDTYLNVTPNVKYVEGVTFNATLDGEPYILGTPISNPIPEITDHTLVVTATKTLNGLTATTIKKFTLDSIPPEIPEIIGVIPNEIQETANPDTVYHDGCTYVLKLNNRNFVGTTLVNEPDDYQFTVVVTKNTNGLMNMNYCIFTIVNEIPPILTNRPYLIPQYESSTIPTIDGELRSEISTGHFSVYDDGLFISKTRELEELINEMINRLYGMQSIENENEDRLKTLSVLKEILLSNLETELARDLSLKNDILNIQTELPTINTGDTSFITEFSNLLIDIANNTEQIRSIIDSVTQQLNNRKENCLSVINDLKVNSSSIGETTWYRNNI